MLLITYYNSPEENKICSPSPVSPYDTISWHHSRTHTVIILFHHQYIVRVYKIVTNRSFDKFLC